MRNFNKSILLILLTAIFISGTYAQVDKVKYVKKAKYPVLKELREQIDGENAAKDSVTKMIRERYSKKKKTERENSKRLRFDFSNVDKPESLKEFTKFFHFDPVAQYSSGMCWCFSATSFLESEIQRRYNEKIKLSELHTVYYEYIEKARRYVRQRGNSEFGQGSESNAVLKIMEQYGAVPVKVYDGDLKYDKHNHTQLFKDMNNFLHYCKDNNFWEEEIIVSTIQSILNGHLGAPPETFKYKLKKYTPLEFFNEVMKLKADEYCGFVSTLSEDFYKQCCFDAPDNWWLDSSYYNIPLDEWYAIIKKSMKNEYSMVIGGDVSEAGIYGKEEVAIVPDFDIPGEYINQDSREYRIYNNTTEDDHGIHLVGHTTRGKGDDMHDWFLIKDSGRSSRQGPNKGYYFFRDDFIRLKMLTFMVHKDIVADILENF